MKTERIETIQRCAAASLNGEIQFPEVIGRLIEAGVERYHVDYSRQESTYYLVDGDSVAIPSPHAQHPTASKFSAARVEAAIRRSQRNEHTYHDFVRETMAAGCVGYFVQITGRKAIYFGRDGDSHVELFPNASVESENG